MWLWIVDHPGESVGIATGLATLAAIAWGLIGAHFRAVHRIGDLERELGKHMREADPILRDRFRDALADLRALEGVVKELRRSHDEDKRDLLDTARAIEQRLGKEIDGLREWRHTVANQLMEALGEIKNEIVGELRRAGREAR